MNIGLIRCEKNEKKCPLTGCLKSLEETTQGFAEYDNAKLVGVFSCRCPGDDIGNLGKILKAKGAEAIHLCTCTFAHKEDGQWQMEDGLCDHADHLLSTLSEATALSCVKGSAHLPEGYAAETF
jgi:predicted metal-binding protein